MASTLQAAKSATVTINPQHQNIDNVQRLVAQILGKGGCDHCGRIAMLKIDFLGDPGPDLAKDGAISIQTVGF